MKKSNISGDPSRTNHCKSAKSAPEQLSTLWQFDVIDFSSSSWPEWTTAWTLCFLDEHPIDCHASVHVPAGEAVVPRALLCVTNRSSWSKHCSLQEIFIFHHWRRWNRRRRSRFWVVDEDTGEEGFTGLYTENEFWVRQKVKVMQHGKMTSPTQLSGAKESTKVKARRARKEWKVRILSKEYLLGKEKEKATAKAKEEKQQANVAQQATSSSTPAPAYQEKAHAEENWGYDDAYWSNDWSEWDTSYYGCDEYDWYSWPSYYVLVEEQAATEDRQDIHVEDGQTDQRQYCFSVECSLDRTPDQSIRNAETSVASDSTVMHTTIPQSEIRSECVFLNYDHGAQQALLCEYVELGSNPTYVILDSGCTRAMGSRFAIDRLVQACQRHPKRDHIWFSTQPCTSKFSFANGEKSTVKERLVIHFRNDHAQNGWITTCVDILDQYVPILFSVEQMRNLRMNIEHTPVGEFLTSLLFGMQRTALSVSTSNHPVLDIMALATSSWKPMYSFASEAITRPACAGKHRPHTYKEGCKKKPVTKKEEPKPAKAITEPKPAETTTAKSVLRKILSPDMKLDVPEKPFEEPPMKSSGQSSGSKDGIPACPEPQPNEPEVKTESKESIRIKTEPVRELSSKGTLSLALQRIHEKLQSPTELLKLHLEHRHMSTEQFKKRTSALKLPKDIYDSMSRLSNNVTHVPRQRLHHLALRFQEYGVKFLENLASLIVEKFLSTQLPNFNSFWFMTVQLLWPLHMLCRLEPIPWRFLISKNTSKRVSWIPNTLLLVKHLWALNWKSILTAKTSDLSL